MRFIHTADWQIGMTRRFLDADAQARFSEARENAIRRIGEVVREHEAAFVVVAGDVFDANLLQPRTVRRALDAMKDIPVPVYLLPGNHDHLGPVSIYQSAEFLRNKPDHVYVLENDHIIEAPGGVELVGVPWLAKRIVEDRVGQAIQTLPPKTGFPRVMVAHGTTSSMGGEDAVGVIYITIVEQALRNGQMDYLALGDRHSTTQCGGSGRIWYAGAPEPTDYDEVDAGNVLVVELGSGEPRVTPVHTGTWHFVEQVLDVEVGAAEAALERFLEALPDKARTIVKVNFRGTITVLDEMKLDAVLEQSRVAFGAIDRHEHRDQLAVLSESGNFEDLALTGYAKEALGRLLESASRLDASEGQRYRDALALYYRLVKEVQ